jgi:alanine dehydrogenase
MNETGKGFLKFSETRQLLPQEEMLETLTPKKKFTIGIPKETILNESRVSLVPDGINLLVENGHTILVQRQAGEKANFSDEDFAAAGAVLVDEPTEIFKSDIIVKVAPPTLDELEMLEKNKVLLSSIYLPQQKKIFFEKLLQKRTLALAYEYIQDRTGTFPVVHSMSEIVGNTAILIAAEYLSNPKIGRGISLGGFPGIKPAEVVIIGAGTVAEYATRTALGMGASVKIFDNSIYKLRAIQNKLGTRLYTTVLQPKELEEALIDANVVIAAKHSSTGRAACFITEEMVKKMKPGAVIVDVSIDQGGCFETSRPTTHENPVYLEHDVIHYCVPNIASRVPHTASWSLSNFLTPLLLNLGDVGGVTNYLKRDEAFSKGVYAFNGTLTNKQIGEKFNMRYHDFRLLLAAL